jgi:hypothetical protein
MTIRALRDALGQFDPDQEAFVVLFRNDGTGEQFESMAVRENHGNAQMEIYAEEEI